MKRRGALLRLAALTCAPLYAFGQSAVRLPRISLVDTAVATADMALGKPYWGALLAELRRLGYVEGKSIAFERWSGAGDIARYPELARSVAGGQPDLIVSRSRSMTVRLAAATQSIPIVAVGTIPAPLRNSLSRPGRNVTGLQVASGDREIYAKAAEILQQVTPKNARAAWLGPKNIWESEVGAAAREGAKQVRLPLEPVLMTTPVNEAAIRDGFAQVRAG